MVFVLDVEHNDGSRPGKQIRDDDTDAFAGARGRGDQHVAGLAIAEIVITEPAQQNTVAV